LASLTDATKFPQPEIFPLTEPKTAEVPALPEFVDLNTAPYFYFDMAPAYGVVAGIVQIELAARTLNPMPDGSVEVKYVTVARLRCSSVAAGHLRDAVNASLKMLERPRECSTIASQLN
jgi:hypothetical protein